MVTYWNPRLTEQEASNLLGSAGEAAEKIRQGGELRIALERLPKASDVEKQIVCNTFRTACTLGQVDATWVWELLSNDEWLKSTFSSLETSYLHALCWGLVELQRSNEDSWRWRLPHLFVALGEVLDLSLDQRRVLALMALRSAIVGRAMGAVQRLLAGRKTSLIREGLLEWKRQFEEIRNGAPAVVSGIFRDVCATLSRYI